MKLSLCLTNYNRFDMLLKSFAEVIDDPRIDEIIISDDCSSEDIWDKLLEWVLKSGNSKIILSRNGANLGMSLNKLEAVGRAKNPWVILFDSDNRIDKHYLDAAEKEAFDDPSVIYMPDFAQPEFDYTMYGGFTFSRSNIKGYLDQSQFFMALNTCNYIVNRGFYLKTYIPNANVKESDTLWHAYNHIRELGKFKVVEGMRYFHRVHPGSGWLEHAEENMIMANAIKENFKNL